MRDLRGFHSSLQRARICRRGIQKCLFLLYKSQLHRQAQLSLQRLYNNHQSKTNPNRCRSIDLKRVLFNKYQLLLFLTTTLRSILICLRMTQHLKGQQTLPFKAPMVPSQRTMKNITPHHLHTSSKPRGAHLWWTLPKPFQSLAMSITLRHREALQRCNRCNRQKSMLKMRTQRGPCSFIHRQITAAKLTS